MASIDIREDEEVEINEVRFAGDLYISTSNLTSNIFSIVSEFESEHDNEIVNIGCEDIDNLIKALQKVKELRDNNK